MRRSLALAALCALLVAGCVGTVEGPTEAATEDPEPTPVNRSLEGLADSQPPETVQLADGDTYEMVAQPVAHDTGEATIRAMAYNGMVPGPELHMSEGDAAEIVFTNRLEHPTTVHWHGLRHDISDDGVPGLTQEPVEPGETFTYTIETPDAGVFWYHPHVRTDMQKELGLYGALIVHPDSREDPAQAWPGETVVHLDDIRLEGGDVPTFYEEVVTFADSGRWGNQPFVDGTAEPTQVPVMPGERHRLHLVNPANARTWRLDFQGFEQVEKITAGASYLEQPREIDELALGPAERATVDVRVGPEQTGRIVDEPTTWTLATVPASSTSPTSGGLASLQAPSGPHEQAQAENREGVLEGEPDHSVHLRMVRNETVPADANASGGHGDHSHGAPEPAKGEVEPMPTTETLNWSLVDMATGQAQPNFTFEVGDVVEFEIDIVHEHGQGGDHAAHAPVPHTIHLHGQRFLVDSYGGEDPPERAWRDTIRANDPVPDYQSTTIRVEMTNPGSWLMHCHISEHGEAGMTALVNVTEPGS